MKENRHIQSEILDVIKMNECLKILTILLVEKPCITSISNNLAISITMVSYYTKRLYLAGLIKYEFDRKDFRRKYLVLTPLGHDVILKYKDGSLFNLH